MRKTLSVLVLPAARMRARNLALRCSPLAVAAPLSALSMLLYASPGGATYWSMGPAAITDRSIWLAIGIALRVCAVALPAIVLLSNIDPTDMGDGLAQILHLPARPILAALAGARMTGLMAAGRARPQRWVRRPAERALMKEATAPKRMPPIGHTIQQMCHPLPRNPHARKITRIRGQ